MGHLSLSPILPPLELSPPCHTVEGESPPKALWSKTVFQNKAHRTFDPRNTFSPLLHSRGERGRKGRECKSQNKAHRTFDPRKTISPVQEPNRFPDPQFPSRNSVKWWWPGWTSVISVEEWPLSTGHGWANRIRPWNSAVQIQLHHQRHCSFFG